MKSNILLNFLVYLEAKEFQFNQGNSRQNHITKYHYYESKETKRNLNKSLKIKLRLMLTAVNMRRN